MNVCVCDGKWLVLDGLLNPTGSPYEALGTYVYSIETNQQVHFRYHARPKRGRLIQASDCPWTFYAVECRMSPTTNVSVLKLDEDGILSETLSFTMRGCVQSIDESFAATKTHILCLSQSTIQWRFATQKLVSVNVLSLYILIRPPITGTWLFLTSKTRCLLREKMLHAMRKPLSSHTPSKNLVCKTICNCILYLL